MTTRTRTPDTLRLPPHRHPVPTRSRVRTRRLPVAVYIVALLALPIAVLGGARATGWWVTTGHTVPATALGAGPFSGAGTDRGTGTDGQPQADMSPHDVKGSMTVQQILDAFPQVSAPEIFELFGAPTGTATSAQLKTLAQNGDGYEVSDFREWLETHPATP